MSDYKALSAFEQAELQNQVEELQAAKVQIAMKDEAMQLAQIVSCSCMAKTPEIAQHSEHCMFRIFGEAISAKPTDVEALWREIDANELSDFANELRARFCTDGPGYLIRSFADILDERAAELRKNGGK